MPAIGQELEETRTARWYRAARSPQRAKAWDERARCFTALSAVLSEHRGAPPIRVPGILTKVARRAHFASAEPVYKRWRAKQDGQPIARWSGTDGAVNPVAAFVAEAKIAAFWPYREGVVKIADAFDMTLTEFVLAYLRVLAAWAGEHPLLAACYPAGPPPCVAEDMRVLAERVGYPGGSAAGQAAASGDASSGAEPDARVARLASVAGDVVGAVLANPAVTSAEATAAAQSDVRALLAEPANSIADRVTYSVAELTERIAADGTVIGAVQAARLLTALRELDAVLSGVLTGALPGALPGVAGSER